LSCAARPEIGQTALLSYAAERSRERTVLGIVGVEAESDLGFAGLEGLLRPIIGKLGELPQAQADALSAALGLAPSRGSDRLLVSAAALSSVLARCRALVGDGDVREQFGAALAPDGFVSPFLMARTELLYGEWLRRERARREARAHLRRAADLFRQVGAPPWEERAESELRATGEP
jgi:hypothetical protein